MKRRVVGYFVEWGVYQRNFQVEDIDTKYITTILYAFLDVGEDGKLHIIDNYASLEKDRDWSDPNSGSKLWGNLGKLQKLKEKEPRLEILFSIGGWSRSKFFSPSVATPERRTRLVNSCVEFLEKYDFIIGADFDWEWPQYPGLQGNIISPDDGKNFTKFLQELRRALPRDKIITLAGPSDPKKIDAFEIEKIEGLIEFFCAMNYDYEGSWSNKVGHHANLYGNDSEFSNDRAIKKYLSKGMPPEKLIMGFPCYSREFARVNAESNEIPIGKQFNGTPQGEYEAGTNTYKYIVEKYESDPSYKKMLDNEKVASYLWNPTKRVVVSYDTPEIVAKKCEYIRNNQLGGIMTWSLDGDHKRNDKSLIQRAYHELNINTSPSDPTPQPSPEPTPVPSDNEEECGECKCKCKCEIKIDKEVKSIKFKGKGKYVKNSGICEFEGEIELEY